MERNGGGSDDDLDVRSRPVKKSRLFRYIAREKQPRIVSAKNTPNLGPEVKERFKLVILGVDVLSVIFTARDYSIIILL